MGEPIIDRERNDIMRALAPAVLFASFLPQADLEQALINAGK